MCQLLTQPVDDSPTYRVWIRQFNSHIILIRLIELRALGSNWSIWSMLLWVLFQTGQPDPRVDSLSCVSCLSYKNWLVHINESYLNHMIPDTTRELHDSWIYPIRKLTPLHWQFHREITDATSKKLREMGRRNSFLWNWKDDTRFDGIFWMIILNCPPPPQPRFK